MIFDKAKAQIDTEFLAALQETKNYPILYTPEYLNYLAEDAFTSNVTFILGNEIPNIQLKSI